MSRRKSLYDKIFDALGMRYERGYVNTVNYLLRLIREDRKRHCAECLRVKNMIDAQIEKNRDEGAELQVRPSVYRDYRPYIRGRNGKSKI